MQKLILFVLIAAALLAACGAPDGGYAGSYQANLADGRIVRLQLDANGAATFVQDPGDGQAPSAANGSWVGSSDALDLSVDGATLTFARGEDNSLTLLDADAAEWGAGGLTLYATTPFTGVWVWQQTVANGQVTDPSTPGAFLLTFTADGRLQARTDCNSGSGAFQVGPQNQLSMPVIATTRMFCEGSNEGDFYAQLGIVESWSLTADGVLELQLGGEGGTMEFVPEA